MRVASVLAVLAGPAWAQGHPCDGVHIQMELNLCSYEGWAIADEELNAAYGEAIATARIYDEYPEGRAEETLRAAQRAWVAFRDAACEAEAALWDGGTGQPMVLYECLELLTAQRNEALWAYASAGGG